MVLICGLHVGELSDIMRSSLTGVLGQVVFWEAGGAAVSLVELIGRVVIVGVPFVAVPYGVDGHGCG